MTAGATGCDHHRRSGWARPLVHSAFRDRSTLLALRRRLGRVIECEIRSEDCCWWSCAWRSPRVAREICPSRDRRWQRGFTMTSEMPLALRTRAPESLRRYLVRWRRSSQMACWGCGARPGSAVVVSLAAIRLPLICPWPGRVAQR